jgi:DNA-directed RNA polymerase subunit RPC12/RpoP
MEKLFMAKMLKPGINTPIICKKCGHRVGFLKIKPEFKKLLESKNKKETWAWIFFVALITQLISQIISDLILK